jgi:hypothetical protein
MGGQPHCMVKRHQAAYILLPLFAIWTGLNSIYLLKLRSVGEGDFDSFIAPKKTKFAIDEAIDRSESKAQQQQQQSAPLTKS